MRPMKTIMYFIIFCCCSCCSSVGGGIVHFCCTSISDTAMIGSMFRYGPR